MPVALFTLVTAERQVFKSSVGVGDAARRRRSRTRSAATWWTPARRWRSSTRACTRSVRDNPAIEDFGIVAYLGMPLTTADGDAARRAVRDRPRAAPVDRAATTACSRTWRARRWPRSSCGSANRAVAAAAAELHFAATHDSLTRLGNRRALLDDLGQLLADGRPATFALLDLARHARLQRRRTATSPATSCWRGSARRLEVAAGRPRARLPARRRAAVRAADRRRGDEAVDGAALRALDAARPAPSAAARVDRRAAARGERASRPSYASPTRRPGTLRACLRPLARTSHERRARARLGGGEEQIARQHEAGKLTARERIALLIDDGTFTELGIHARPHFSQRAMDGREAPADGVITGYGRVDGRMVAVAAYDFTVMAGSMGMTGEIKVTRAARAGADQADPVRLAARLAPARGSRRRSARCSPAPATCSARRS